jgi:hypothetical protein
MADSYSAITNEGQKLNAYFEVEDSAIILHCRGGAKGGSETNPDYAALLRLLLHRLADNNLVIRGAWVDSNRVKSLSLSGRELLGQIDKGANPDELFTRLTSRMQKVGRAKYAAGSGGNRTKRIRIELEGHRAPGVLAQVLEAVNETTDLKISKRLTSDTLYKVTAEQVWNAVQLLLGGYDDHDFGPSTDFDLINDDGRRLPPKAVFGVAAREALGFRVLPSHFSAGHATPCFRVLKAAGYDIGPKLDVSSPSSIVAASYGSEWSEGKPVLVSHLRKERGRGLAEAKKAEFRRVHGKLVCERCGVDPVAHYATRDGEACIEVHHYATQVKDMDLGHTTKLEDLQCLCANCHRIVHRLLKTELLVDDKWLEAPKGIA